MDNRCGLTIFDMDGTSPRHSRAKSFTTNLIMLLWCVATLTGLLLFNIWILEVYEDSIPALIEFLVNYNI